MSYSCSPTLISYKGDKISCLCHFVFEIWRRTDRRQTDRQTTDDRRSDRNRRLSHCKCASLKSSYSRSPSKYIATLHLWLKLWCCTARSLVFTVRGMRRAISSCHSTVPTGWSTKLNAVSRTRSVFRLLQLIVGVLAELNNSFCIIRSSLKRWPNKSGKNVRPYVRPYIRNETQCSHKPNSCIC